MQNSSVSTSIIGMKNRVMLRRGIWIMTAPLLPPIRAGSVSDRVFPAPFAHASGSDFPPLSRRRLVARQGQDQPAPDEDHPRRQDVQQGHQQPAAGGRDRRGVQLDDL